jgi:hypothetical protein
MKSIEHALGAALMCLLSACPALAEGLEPQRFEISAMAGWQWGGSVDMAAGNGSLDSGPGFDGIIAYRVQEDGLMALTYSVQRTDFTANFLDVNGKLVRRTVPVNVGYAHFMGELELPRSERFVPFIGLSVGATHFTPRGQGETGWFFSAAFIGGIKYRITDHLGLRTQMRMLATVINGDSRIFCASSGGLTCAFSTSLEGMLQGDIVGGLYVAF